MKDHVANFFLFDLLLFGLFFLLYDSGVGSHPFFEKVFQTNFFSSSDQKSFILNLMMQPQPMTTGLYLYAATWFSGRFLPSCSGTDTILLGLCLLAGLLFFTPLTFLDVRFGILTGIVLILFLHWRQSYHCLSLRLAYLVLGLGVLFKGLLMLQIIAIVLSLFLLSSPSSKKKVKDLFDPVGLILFIIILLLKKYSCITLNSYSVIFLPALALILLSRINSIGIQKYRSLISGGFALLLPAGALMTSCHSEGFQYLLQNLLSLPYWGWLVLSVFGISRMLRYRQSLWPELTMVFQIIPLVLSELNLNIASQDISFLQNILIQNRRLTPSLRFSPDVRPEDLLKDEFYKRNRSFLKIS